MSAYVSMLRGINVGGKTQIRMDSLRGIYEEAGFSKVRTYVQSGNVVFESSEQEVFGLEKRIEAHIEQACGFSIPVLIRQVHELLEILTCNPFLNERNEDPSKLHVTFLQQTPLETAWSKIVAPSGIVDEFWRGDRAVYVFCPNGYGKTKLTNGFFERKLGVMATTRNWNTVINLYSIAIEK
jgi:uncharacterized protein (DUF1697 family)